MKKHLDRLITKAKKDGNILSAMAFGSFARGEPARDIDVCLILAKKTEKLKMSKIRLEYLTDFPSLDIQIFQQLPLYIRVRILKEGKVLFCKNEDLFYDIASETAREFESYRYIYKSFLEEATHA